MMQDISPETMQRMMKMGTYLQGPLKILGWAARNKTTAVSLAVLFISMVVSYFMRWGWFARGPIDMGGKDAASAAAAAEAAGEKEEEAASGGGDATW